MMTSVLNTKSDNILPLDCEQRGMHQTGPGWVRVERESLGIFLVAGHMAFSAAAPSYPKQIGANVGVNVSRHARNNA